MCGYSVPYTCMMLSCFSEAGKYVGEVLGQISASEREEALDTLIEAIQKQPRKTAIIYNHAHTCAQVWISAVRFLECKQLIISYYINYLFALKSLKCGAINA